MAADRQGGDVMPLVPVKACIVGGKPVGKARPRLGRGGRVYTPKATVKAERAVAAAWRAQVGIRHTGPVHVSLANGFAVPRSIAKAERARRLATAWHTQKPDIDNVVKLVLDALNGVAYDDDTQVVAVSTTKRWALLDGMTITIVGA